MRITPDDVRPGRRESPTLPRGRTWRIELAVAVIGLLAGLIVAIVFLT